MSEATFVVEGDVNVRVTVNDDGGNLNFQLEVLETGPSDAIGDLRAFYFDVDGICTNPSLTGAQVTSSGTNTHDLGGDTNLNGETTHDFDFGVEFGTPGIGSDDVRTTSFTLDCDETMSVDMLSQQLFGTRLTSVGTEGGDRDDSSKNVDVPCVEVCEENTVGFDQFSAGDVINFIQAGSVGIRVKGFETNEFKPDNDAMIFDADQAPPVSGGDDDLLAGKGNVLIITEDDNRKDPDDANKGGKFIFNFNKAVDLTSLDVIDTEEGGSIKAFGAGGKFLGNVAVPILPDNGIATVDLGRFDDVKKLVVTFKGSAALDDLAFDYCHSDCDTMLL